MKCDSNVIKDFDFFHFRHFFLIFSFIKGSTKIQINPSNFGVIWLLSILFIKKYFLFFWFLYSRRAGNITKLEQIIKKNSLKTSNLKKIHWLEIIEIFYGQIGGLGQFLTQAWIAIYFQLLIYLFLPRYKALSCNEIVVDDGSWIYHICW